jgi:hypothetical protein
MFDFEAKADSKNRHRQIRYRYPCYFQKPNVIQHSLMTTSISRQTKNSAYAEFQQAARARGLRQLRLAPSAQWLQAPPSKDLY